MGAYGQAITAAPDDDGSSKTSSAAYRTAREIVKQGHTPLPSTGNPASVQSWMPSAYLRTFV